MKNLIYVVALAAVLGISSCSNGSSQQCESQQCDSIAADSVQVDSVAALPVDTLEITVDSIAE